MSDRSNREPPPDLRNNKIAIAMVLGLVAVGIVWYGLTAAFHPAIAPVVHATSPAEPTGQGPGTPGRL